MFPDSINESLKIICFGYRQWSKNIYRALSEHSLLDRHSFILINDKKLVNSDFIDSIKPDLILFYGWSEIINSKIIENYTCLMLHPSALPKYRGGSPIQNQIINDIEMSKVCIFKMESEIDSGSIIKSAELDLTGELKTIFERIECLGTKLTIEFLIEGFNPIPQIGIATYCKRRKPSDSEITLKEIQESSAKYLYNKIRMLNTPYPNAFIRCSDGKKLFITKSYIE